MRASLAVLGATALAFAAVWTADVVLGAGAASVYDSIRIVGFLGALAWIVAGSSGVAYARTGARPWAAAVAGGLLMGLLLFVAWTDMHDTTGCG